MAYENITLRQYSDLDILVDEEDLYKAGKLIVVFQFNLTLQDSLSSKTVFLLHTLFDYSDRDVMMVNLPKSLYFLYYTLRIVRILENTH